MAVGKSTGSPFTTQVILSGGSQSDGDKGSRHSSPSHEAPLTGDKIVDVARQGKRASGRGDSFPDGYAQERAVGTLAMQSDRGPSLVPAQAASAGSPFADPAAHRGRNYSRPVAELLLRRYAVTPALERLREAAGCEDRRALARWFRAREWDVDEAESRGVIPAEWLLDIFLIKGVNPNWILTGRGSRYLHPASASRPLADGDLVEACLNARSAD